MEAIKITQSGSGIEDYDFKIHIGGKNMNYNPNEITILDCGHKLYTVEYNFITKFLAKFQCSWNDIKELCYVCGLRAPYHLEPKGFLDCLCSTVDGYQVYIKLK